MVFIERPDVSLKLAEEVQLCDDFFARLLGALPEGGVKEKTALIMPGCGYVHTFFMREPIDVLYFDTDGTPLTFYREAPPYRLLSPESSPAGTIELPPGTLPDPVSSEDRLQLVPELAAEADLPGLARGRGG